MRRKHKITSPCFILGFISLLFLAADYGWAGSAPKKGSPLPDFQISSPSNKEDAGYLSLEYKKKFSVEDIDYKLLFIEIIGVYCPQCHKQLPLNKKLYFRIKKNPRLAKKVKMIAIAAGANTNEIEYLINHFKIPYPVFPDTKFKIHKLLGEPRTPYTMLVTKDKKIKYAHLGIIQNMDQFYQKISRIVAGSP